MTYEVIQEIENNCANNQLRDVFFTEEEIADPDEWIRRREPDTEIRREELPHGIRYRVNKCGLPIIYLLTEAE